MSGLIRFLQRSVGEIHHSVNAYIEKSIVIPCQACSSHVQVRVIDFLAKPEKPMGIKCTECGHIVCFTAKQSTVREAVGPEPSVPLYHPERTTYNAPLSPETRTIYSQIDGNNFHQGPMIGRGQLVSSASPKPASQSISGLRQDTPTGLSELFSDNLRIFYRGRSSTSKGSSNECSEDQDSVLGQSCSLRSSISLARRPSLPCPSNMLGFDQCWEKSGASNPSWSPSILPSWLYPTPPKSASLTSLCGSLRSLSPDERALKRDCLVTPIELGKREDGHTLGFFLNHEEGRDMRDSVDLTSGKVEMKSHMRRDSDQLAQLHLFAVDVDTEKNPELTPSIDSDRGSIRGNISEKRRGKLPQRPNAIHRAAVSRRHSQKIEQQEQQEQQHEAKKLSAKRRNSLNSDFEVEPSDEQVRQAQIIYTNAKQQQLPYQEIDVQWARGILRARKNWEALRYEHPLMEQFQLRHRNNVESTISPHYSEPTRHSLPFGVSNPPNMSPNMLSLPLQHLPTPVKEELEYDTQAPGFAERSPNYFPPESSGSVGLPSNSVGTLNIGPEKAGTSEDEITPSTGGDRLDHPSGKKGPNINSTDPPKIFLPKRKNVNTRCRKALKNAARRISCFHGIAPPSSSPPQPPPLPIPQPPSTSIPSVETVTTPELEISSAEGPRSSGEIYNVPTSEEPFRLVGDAITSLVEPMRTPFIQIQVEARPEDLFAR